jgi:hypothetical protein
MTWTGCLVLCHDPMKYQWAGYLILGQDPVDDYGQDTSPLILQSAKLKNEKLISLFSADHGLILEVYVSWTTAHHLNKKTQFVVACLV